MDQNRAVALKAMVSDLTQEIAIGRKRLTALGQSLIAASNELACEKEKDMPDDLTNTRPARCFDWLRAHLGFFDKIAPDAPGYSHMTQETWEKLLGDGIDVYVVNSSSFMKKDIPVSYLPPENK
jgi:hypothetical protein